MDSNSYNRLDAIEEVWQVLEWATSSDVRLRDEVVFWLDERSSDYAGFLWLAGQLGCRPSALDGALRVTVGASSQRRQGILNRIQRLRSKHDESES